MTHSLQFVQITKVYNISQLNLNSIWDNIDGWMELVKNYDCEISYHLGKANKVTDALSRRLAIKLASLLIKPNLLARIKNLQAKENKLQGVSKLIHEVLTIEFHLNSKGLLWLQDRFCVPKNQGLRNEIMTKAHNNVFSVHPGSTKVYHDLKGYY